MTCTNCQNRIEQELKNTAGILNLLVPSVYAVDRQFGNGSSLVIARHTKNHCWIFYDTHGNQYAGHFSSIKKDSDQTAQKVRYKDRSEKRTEKRPFVLGKRYTRAVMQYVKSDLDFGSYPEITVYTGIPVKWNINMPDEVINGCNYKMVLKTYGITHEFTAGENVIEYTPEESGTVEYICWMGMIYGKINIIDSQGE